MSVVQTRWIATLFSVSISLGIAALALPKDVSSPPVLLQRVPNGGIQPQLLTDQSGKLHLLYFSGDPAHGDLYYVWSLDGGKSWSSPLRVNSDRGTAIALGTIRGGQMAIGKQGRVHVAWNGSSQAAPKVPNPEAPKQEGAPMLYSRLNDSATVFEPERNLMTSTFGLDGGGTIAADARGNVYVSWHGKTPGAPAGEGGRQVWLATSSDDGKTFSREKPATNDPTGACGCCGMAMFSDSRGIVRALYRSATESVHRDIYLLTSPDQARTFSDRKLDAWSVNACPMSSMAFAERGGRVEAAWETGSQVYFENVLDPNAKPLSPPNHEKSHKHPRLSIAANGDTLLVWTAGTGWNRGGSVAWQLFDSKQKPMAEKGTLAGLPAWSFAAAASTAKGFLVLY